MRRLLASVTTFAFLAGLSLVMAGEAKVATFQGLITDDVCGKNHANGDSAGVTKCVEKGAHYALYDAKSDRVYLLSDQAKAKEFAAAQVTVQGTLSEDGKTITVTSIQKDQGKAGA